MMDRRGPGRNQSWLNSDIITLYTCRDWWCPLIPCKDGQCPGWDLNSAPCECNKEVAPLEQTCLAYTTVSVNYVQGKV